MQLLIIRCDRFPKCSCNLSLAFNIQCSVANVAILKLGASPHCSILASKVNTLKSEILNWPMLGSKKEDNQMLFMRELEAPTTHGLSKLCL